MTASPDVVVIVSLQGAPGAPAAWYCTDTGEANALAVTVAAIWTDVPEGTTLMVKVAAVNTGASTITIEIGNSLELGPFAIVYGGQVLPAGALGAGLMAMLVFDGEAFQLMALSVSGGAAGGDPGFFFPSGQLAVAATVL
ncbi:MAG TPA: hypothetical protein VG248_17185 [Caulobacteraceae bacterium]|jgi:hypothetical protein|nr:hypothetical protein [Caulobacteraceae bacterium]